MPLQHGDIEVFSIASRTVKLSSGKMQDVKEIRYRVRGQTEDALYIPLEEFSKSHAEQLLMRAAAEIVDLLEQFPIKE